MSIGLATAFENTIILVSDGRRTGISQSKTSYQDDINKLTLLEPSLVIMALGLADITDHALINIKANYAAELELGSFLLLLHHSLTAAWKNARFPSDTDFTKPFMQGVFLAGGFLGGAPFITTVSYRREGQDSLEVFNQVPFVVAAGNGQEAAADMFQDNLNEALRGLDNEHGFKDRNDRVIKCAAETIRHIEPNEPTVGGVIRYAIVDRKQPYITGIFTEKGIITEENLRSVKN